jgi:hypothetical protein
MQRAPKEPKLLPPKSEPDALQMQNEAHLYNITYKAGNFKSRVISIQSCSFTGKFDLAYFTGIFTGNNRKLPKNKKIKIESHNFLLNKLVNILSFFQFISKISYKFYYAIITLLML